MIQLVRKERKKAIKSWRFFKSIVAPLDYSFSNFKLIPRDSADFEGYKPVLNVKLENGNIPIAFKLEANYPNPLIRPQQFVTLL